MTYHAKAMIEPSNCVFLLIDHQPQMLFGVANADRATMINNVTLLAKVAKEFKVPTVLTSVETESFSGYVWPQLLDIFPGQPVIERSSMNSWDSMEFRKAIDATGRKKKPSLRSDRVQRATDGEIFWLLKNGSLKHGMPSWSAMPEPMRWQVVTYVKSLGTSWLGQSSFTRSRSGESGR